LYNTFLLQFNKTGNFSKIIDIKDGKLFSTEKNWGKMNFYNIGKFFAKEIGLVDS
jgi:hypothetical protein